MRFEVRHETRTHQSLITAVELTFSTASSKYTFSAEHAQSTVVKEKAGCGSTPEASTKFCIDPDE